MEERNCQPLGEENKVRVMWHAAANQPAVKILPVSQSSVRFVFSQVLTGTFHLQLFPATIRQT